MAAARAAAMSHVRGRQPSPATAAIPPAARNANPSTLPSRTEAVAQMAG